MPLLPEETDLQKDTLETKEGILTVAEAAHNLVEVQTAIFQRFWNRSPDRILAELNSDVARYAAILNSNTALGTPANAQLDALDLPDKFPRRAPVTMPEGWAFSEETGFSYTPSQPAS